MDIRACLVRSSCACFTGDLDRRCSRDPLAETTVEDDDEISSTRPVEDDGLDAPFNLEIPEGPVGGCLTGRLAESRLPKNSPTPGGLKACRCAGKECESGRCRWYDGPDSLLPDSYSRFLSTLGPVGGSLTVDDEDDEADGPRGGSKGAILHALDYVWMGDERVALLDHAAHVQGSLRDADAPVTPLSGSCA